MLSGSSSALRSISSSVIALMRFQSIERMALRICSGVTFRRTYLGSPDLPEALPFLMSRSPYRYDARDFTSHGEDTSEFHSIQQTDGDVAYLATQCAQADPLHRCSCQDQRRSTKSDPCFSRLIRSFTGSNSISNERIIC